MGSYSRTYSFTDGTTAYGSQVAAEFDAVGTSVNNIVNAQISAGAAIADSKLAQITTPSKVSGAAITGLASLPSGAGEIPNANIQDGHVLQVVNTLTGAVSTGTTLIPLDDSIPQKTEGDEYMTLAITPKATTNKLRIDVVVFGSHSAGGIAEGPAAALFQDDTANALAAGFQGIGANNGLACIAFTHYMAAGTTSATTFKVRAGGSAAGTFTFNGTGGGRIYGGKCASSITITEVKAS